MTQAERERFDALVEEAIETLPPRFREALEEVPVVVVDRPSRELVRQLRREGVLPPADGAGPVPAMNRGRTTGRSPTTSCWACTPGWPSPSGP